MTIDDITLLKLEFLKSWSLFTEGLSSESRKREREEEIEDDRKMPNARCFP